MKMEGELLVVLLKIASKHQGRCGELFRQNEWKKNLVVPHRQEHNRFIAD